jgi:hypothetical protein
MGMTSGVWSQFLKGKIPGPRFPSLSCVRVLKIRHFGREGSVGAHRIFAVVQYESWDITLLTIQLDRGSSNIARPPAVTLASGDSFEFIQ